MASIDEQIKANNAKIDANNAEISTLKQSGNEWIADGQNDNCDKAYHPIQKAKIAACKIESQRKIQLGQDRLAQATVLESMNTQLMADNKALTKQRDAEAQSMVILAQQGTTTAAVQTKASAEAESAKIIAESNAQAIATKATTDASNSTTDSKTKMMVTVVVVVLILAVLGTILYKKFKKAKK